MADQNSNLLRERPPGPPIALAAALGVWLIGPASPFGALMALGVAAIVTLIVMRVERIRAPGDREARALADLIAAAERRLGIAGEGDLVARLHVLLSRAAPEAREAPLVAVYVRDAIARAEALQAAEALGFATCAIETPDTARALTPGLVVAHDRDVAAFAGVDAPLIALCADLADGALAMRAGATAFVTIASGRAALIAAMARYARGRAALAPAAPVSAAKRGVA